MYDGCWRDGNYQHHGRPHGAGMVLYIYRPGLLCSDAAVVSGAEVRPEVEGGEESED